MISENGLHIPAEWAMFIAVSRLSPVKIQILMFARWSFTIVSGTPSCSLSSIPVAPRKI